MKLGTFSEHGSHTTTEQINNSLLSCLPRRFILRIGHINLARGFSGGEQQTLNLVRELAYKEVDQLLICRGSGRLAESVSKLGVEVIFVKHWLGSVLPYPKVDIWHAHDGKAVHYAAIHHRLRKTPFLITRRVDNPIKENLFTRNAYRSAFIVACLSHAIKDMVHRLDPSITTTIIPSSFSTFDFNLFEAALIRKQHQGKFLIGQVGSLLQHKGQHITIEAARILENKIPTIHFLLLGNGPEKDSLLAASKGLSNISFLGHKRDIGPYFSAFNLFVFPSLSEGLGSSILEAMQAKVPVIASRAGGIPDIVEHHVTGLLVDRENPLALAEAIEYLYHHPAERLRLAQNALNQLQRFSPAKIAARYIQIYQTAMGDRASQHPPL